MGFKDLSKYWGEGGLSYADEAWSSLPLSTRIPPGEVQADVCHVRYWWKRLPFKGRILSDAEVCSPGLDVGCCFCYSDRFLVERCWNFCLLERCIGGQVPHLHTSWGTLPPAIKHNLTTHSPAFWRRRSYMENHPLDLQNMTDLIAASASTHPIVFVRSSESWVKFVCYQPCFFNSRKTLP